MTKIDDLSEALLLSFDLTDILEMNDLEEETVLSILIDMGRIKQPERLIKEFEELEWDED